MAYAEYNVASVRDIRDAIADFASQMGWVVTLSNSEERSYRIKRSNDPGEVEFRLQYYTSSHLINRLIGLAVPDETDITALTDVGEYEYFSGSDNPSYAGNPSITRLHGEMGDNPWILASVECAGGSFRHIAFGYLEKLGDYEGGEFYTTSMRSGTVSWSSSSSIGKASGMGYFRRMDEAFGMFGAFRHTSSGININYPDRGAVKINGTWYAYRHAVGSNNEYSVFGGPPALVPILGPFVGTNEFSSNVPLIPFNHYFGNLSPNSGFWIPIGQPPGIRSVDITNFHPLERVTLGDGSIWRIYPSLRKGSMTEQNQEETTGPIGVAVRESV